MGLTAMKKVFSLLYGILLLLFLCSTAYSDESYLPTTHSTETIPTSTNLYTQAKTIIPVVDATATSPPSTQAQTMIPMVDAIATSPPSATPVPLAAVAAPQFDAQNGTEFVISATLHLVCPTEGAAVYYTVDGSRPDPQTAFLAGPQDPIILTEPGRYTLKAVGVVDGLADSSVTTLVVAVLARVSRPTLDPQPSNHQTFQRTVAITFGCATEGATLWYTTDGSPPEPNGASSHPVFPGDTVEWNGIGTTTVRVKGSAPGMADSAVAQAVYTVVLPPFDTVPIAEAQPEGDSSEVQVLSFAVPVPTGNLDENQVVYGKLALVDDPLGRFSFAPPSQGCGALELMTDRAKSFAEETAAKDDQFQGSTETPVCQVAMSAGFFDPTTGQCTGNLVSQGNVLQATGTENVNFGVRNGSFVIGQLDQDAIESVHGGFQELVSGVGWLVRLGQNIIAKSLQSADLSIVDTLQGTTFSHDSQRRQAFAEQRSHRSAIGTTQDGKMVLVTAEGGEGYTLEEFADSLLALGVWQAVNLVGGPYAGLAVRGTLVTSPSGACQQAEGLGLESLRCEQAVSSIACIHSRGVYTTTSTAEDTSVLAPTTPALPKETEVTESTSGPVSSEVPQMGNDEADIVPCPENDVGLGEIHQHDGISPFMKNGSLSQSENIADIEDLCLPFSSSNDKLKTSLAVLVLMLLVSLAGNISGYLKQSLTGTQTKTTYVRHQEMRSQLPVQHNGGLRGFTRLGDEDGEEEVEIKLYGDRRDMNQQKHPSRSAGRKLKSMLKTVQGKVTRRKSSDDGMKEIDLEINPFEASSYSRIPTIQRSESQDSLVQ